MLSHGLNFPKGLSCCHATNNSSTIISFLVQLSIYKGEGELGVQAKILISYENFYWVDRDE